MEQKSLKRRTGEILLKAKLINEQQLQTALQVQSRLGGRLGEILIRLEFITEEHLIRSLSNQLQIPIIAPNRLKTLKIPSEVLELIPVDVAKEHKILPLLLDEKDDSLSMLMFDPTDGKTVEEIRIVAKVSKINLFLAKKSTIDILIDQFYQGKEPPREKTGLEEMAATSTPDRAPAKLISLERSRHKVLVATPSQDLNTLLCSLFEQEGSISSSATSFQEIYQLLQANAADLVIIKNDLPGYSPEQEVELKRAFPNLDFRAVSSFSREVLSSPIGYEQIMDFYFSTLEVFLNLQNTVDTQQFRITQTTVHYARLIAQKLGLSRKKVDEIILAGYFHNLPAILSPGSGQKTASLEETSQSKTEFATVFNSPLDINPVLNRLSENFDGSGSPDGLKGDEIPIGSRILSAAEHFAIRHRSASDPPLTSKLLTEFFKPVSGSRFDPNVLKTLINVYNTEDALGIEKTGRESVLVADPDQQLVTWLRLKLSGEGIGIHWAHNGDEAMKMLSKEKPDLVISEVALPRIDGYNLCQMVREKPETQNLPFLFLSSRKDPMSVTKGLDMGADDFMSKPVNFEILLAKINKGLEKRREERLKKEQERGVSGSLLDMEIIDIAQILASGMKTALIQVTDQKLEGKIFVDRGQIVHAEAPNLSGRDALYNLITWKKGSFQIIHNITSLKQTISESVDAVLLEGLRRLDEAGRG